MVAAFHSLVGLAATVTSIATIMLAAEGAHGEMDGVHMTTAFLGDVIGAITLTGSVSLGYVTRRALLVCFECRVDAWWQCSIHRPT
jgi:NAD/NADP transhydrogenase beta subunit